MEYSEGLTNPFFTCHRLSAKYSILEKIGEGSLSNVFKIRSKSKGTHFALKAFNHLHVKSDSHQIAAT